MKKKNPFKSIIFMWCVNFSGKWKASTKMGRGGKDTHASCVMNVTSVCLNSIDNPNKVSNHCELNTAKSV